MTRARSCAAMPPPAAAESEVIMKPHCIVQSRSALVVTQMLVAFCAATAIPPGARAMDRAEVEPGIELEYSVRGAREPVVLVHAGLFAEWFRPLLEEPALAARYRVLTFHRVGYAGSSRAAGPVGIARQAMHVRALM